MKLRLRGNSIRLRLTQSEVARFGREGKVEETVRFNESERDLLYTLEIGAESDLFAKFADGAIRVFIPEKQALEWVDSQQVGVETPVGSSLRVLVEKDFACSEVRPGENEEDAFPNPRNEARSTS